MFSHFTSPHYRALLEATEVQISMEGKGRAVGNIFVDRLWRSVKYEELYLHEYACPCDVRLGLERCFDFYNYKRLYHALSYYRTPAEVYH